uniref:Uncharacterized protein n=1 Tax=Manihot esculenta TaxID=3983 RepID=A0A2C9WGD3_MANES
MLNKQTPSPLTCHRSWINRNVDSATASRRNLGMRWDWKICKLDLCNKNQIFMIPKMSSF